jgi:hypothetical protein
MKIEPSPVNKKNLEIRTEEIKEKKNRENKKLK